MNGVGLKIAFGFVALWAVQQPTTGAPALGRVTIPVRGAPFQARLFSIDAAWHLNFEVDGGPQVLPAANLVRWGGRVDFRRGIVVTMTNGGTLLADQVELEGETLSAICGIWGGVRLPLDKVSGVLFALPMAHQQRDRLLDRVMAADRGNRDQLLVANGDVLRGALHGLDSETTVFTTSPSDEVSIAIGRVTAIIFGSLGDKTLRTSDFHCLVGFRDGSHLPVSEANLEGGHLRVTTTDGVLLSTDRTVNAADEITLLQPLHGDVTYLSDLQPQDYTNVPFLEMRWPLGIDRAVSGGQLRAKGVVYSKGLGMHSASRVAFRLDGQYERFAAELAIDDSAGGGGSVLFRVYVDDDQGDWRQVYESPTVRGVDPSLPATADIRGAKTLVLTVDFADRGDQLDRADWLDARVIK